MQVLEPNHVNQWSDSSNLKRKTYYRSEKIQKNSSKLQGSDNDLSRPKSSVTEIKKITLFIIKIDQSLQICNQRIIKQRA